MSKGGDEDHEKKEVPSLPEFKNRADHVIFNKTLRQLTANLNLLRPKGFTKFMVIGCSDADWKKIKKSCDDLKAIEEDDSSLKTQEPRSNHRMIYGVLDDILAYQQESDAEYNKEAHEELYADMAIWWANREDQIESKDDAEERSRVWRLIEKAIPNDMRKYFSNLAIGDIPGVIQRVLELKAKTSVEEVVEEEKYAVEDAVEDAAESLVVEDAANGVKALFAGTSTTILRKACYHMAIGRKCFKGGKCGYSHDDDDVQRFKKILEARRLNVKCHGCGQLGHMKAQCKASASTTQGSIDDEKTQTTKTKTTLAHEDSVEVLMKKLREMKNGKAAVRAMAMEVAILRRCSDSSVGRDSELRQR